MQAQRTVAIKIIPKSRLTEYERSLVDQEIEVHPLFFPPLFF